MYRPTSLDGIPAEVDRPSLCDDLVLVRKSRRPHFLRDLLVSLDLSGHRQCCIGHSGRRTVRLLVLLWPTAARRDGQYAAIALLPSISTQICTARASHPFGICARVYDFAGLHRLWVLDCHAFGNPEDDPECVTQQCSSGR